MILEERLEMLGDPGSEDEDSPQAEDDARDRGEELDHRRDRRCELLRRDLGEEERDPDRDRDGDDERDQRRQGGAVDEGERPELLGDGIPGLRPDEGETEVLDRRPGEVEDLVRDPAEQEHAARGRREGEPAEQRVAEPEPAALEAGRCRTGRGRRGVVECRHARARGLSSVRRPGSS
jgi:hypothetical protein